MLPDETTAHDEDAVDLRAYVAVLGRRWKVVLAVVAVTLIAALGLSFSQGKKYRAESELLIQQRSAEALIADTPVVAANEAARALNNEVRLFESETVQEAVDEAYDGPLDVEGVSASVVSDASDVVQAAVTASDPEDAAELVNVYVGTFLEVRRQQRVEELLAVGTEIRTKVDELSGQIDQIRAPLDEVERRLAEAPGNSALLTQRNALAESLSPQLTPLESQRAFYQSQLEELDFVADVESAGAAQVITSAEPPTSPVSPNPVRDGAVALVLGAVLGVGVAFLVDTLDERVRTASDLERVAGHLPTLALIPESPRGGEGSFVAARDDARSPVAEAFRTLRTAVKFASIDQPISVIQVTSATSGEGKTTTVANLAVALAQGGDRVAVVCCDLRRPRLHERMGVSQVPGLTDVLLGEVTLDEAVRRYDTNVFILPAGSLPPNPSELLSSQKATAVIRALVEKVDLVVIDCTPVLPVSDALVVSRMSDATIVVADARSTDRKALRRTLQMLGQVNAPTVGLVLNGLPEGGDYGYGYGYGYIAEPNGSTPRASEVTSAAGRTRFRRTARS
jgi:capsular exopolysaccharide synthesis family protein